MAFSHSQLETYENCPLKYRLQYLERIAARRRSVEAFMGSTVHAALEKLYRDILMSRCPDVDELSRYYLDLWDSTCDDGVFVVRSDYCVEDYRRTGLRCVRDYHHRYYPFDRGVPVWLERKVRIPLRSPGGERIEFSGVLDRLDCLEEGRYEIHDYKTSMTLPTQDELQRDRQLSLYQLAVEEAFADAREVDLVWHYLAFGRELRLRRDREELEGIAAAAVATAQAIECAREFPARESALCKWCDVQEHCPKRKHLFMVACPERQLGTERGVELADEYAEWQRRRKEAEEHLDALKGEILDFSTAYGVDNLQGSCGVLKISRAVLPKLPPTHSREREQLESALRDAGAWDKASTLNARKLAAVLASPDLPDEVRESLEALMAWEEVSTLRMSGG